MAQEAASVRRLYETSGEYPNAGIVASTSRIRAAKARRGRAQDADGQLTAMRLQGFPGNGRQHDAAFFVDLVEGWRQVAVGAQLAPAPAPMPWPPSEPRSPTLPPTIRYSS